MSQVGKRGTEVSPTSHVLRLVVALAGGLVFLLVVRSLVVSDVLADPKEYKASVASYQAERPARHMVSTACVECHRETYDEHTGGNHAKLACATCHGPALGHLTQSSTRAPMAVHKSRDACLGCHAIVEGRPKEMKQIDPPRHIKKNTGEPNAECLECHEVHAP